MGPAAMDLGCLGLLAGTAFGHMDCRLNLERTSGGGLMVQLSRIWDVICILDSGGSSRRSRTAGAAAGGATGDGGTAGGQRTGEGGRNMEEEQEKI